MPGLISVSLSLSIFILFNASFLSAIEDERNSFSIDLIHRDSTLSPLYNNSSPLSINGVMNHFNSSSYIDAKYVGSDMSHTSNEYLIKIHISKSYEVVAIASMTSDLIWIQCAPCDHCYPQDKPFYQPSESSTYKQVPYKSHFCKALEHIELGKESGECLYYKHKSGEHKFTSGVLSTETLYLESSTSFDLKPYKNKVFGCGTKNTMVVPGFVQGVVGLGRGDLSLVSQLGSKISGTFSYCLRKDHINTISKLKFGPQPSIEKKTSTLKLYPQPHSTSSLYVLNLKAINIKGEKFEVSEPDRDIVLDIGTSVTSFPESIYNKLIESLKKVMGDEIKRVNDPTGKSRLCFRKDDIPDSGVGAIPDMIFKFVGANFVSGTELTLTRSNTFVNYENKLLCMMITKSTDGRSVLGSTAQKGFRVEYETGKNIVTFIKTTDDCAELSG